MVREALPAAVYIEVCTYRATVRRSRIRRPHAVVKDVKRRVTAARVREMEDVVLEALGRVDLNPSEGSDVRKRQEVSGETGDGRGSWRQLLVRPTYQGKDEREMAYRQMSRWCPYTGLYPTSYLDT